jgi:hypothetical protein
VRGEVSVADLPQPLTPADAARLREAFLILGTISDPELRARALARVVIVCSKLGVSSNQLIRLD